VTGGSSWHTVLPVIHPQLPGLLSVFPDPHPSWLRQIQIMEEWGEGAGGWGEWVQHPDRYWDPYGLAPDPTNRPWS